MFNKKRNMVQNNVPYPNNQYYPKNYTEHFEPNNYDFIRLQNELKEMKRIQTEMLNRISRLENYLGIRGELNSNIN